MYQIIWNKIPPAPLYKGGYQTQFCTIELVASRIRLITDPMEIALQKIYWILCILKAIKLWMILVSLGLALEYMICEKPLSPTGDESTRVADGVTRDA